MPFEPIDLGWSLNITLIKGRVMGEQGLLRRDALRFLIQYLEEKLGHK